MGRTGLGSRSALSITSNYKVTANETDSKTSSLANAAAVLGELDRSLQHCTIHGMVELAIVAIVGQFGADVRRVRTLQHDGDSAWPQLSARPRLFV